LLVESVTTKYPLDDSRLVVKQCIGGESDP